MKTASVKLDGWDLAGTMLSALCVAHCIATPVVFLLFPSIATMFSSNEGLVHTVLFGMVALVGAAAFIPKYQLHRKLWPFTWFGVGLSLLGFASFFAHDISHDLEPVLAIIASSFLILAHYLNHRSCQHSCENHPQEH